MHACILHVLSVRLTRVYSAGHIGCVLYLVITAGRLKESIQKKIVSLIAFFDFFKLIRKNLGLRVKRE